MAKQNSLFGCFIILVMGALAVFVFYMFTAKRDHQMSSAREAVFAHHDVHGSGADIVLRSDDQTHIYDPSSSKGPSLKEFARHRLGQTTTLAREMFEKNASGKPVTWTMKLSDVREGQNEQLIGTFSIRLEYRKESSSTSGSISPKAEFHSSQRAALLRLAPDQVVTISGVLDLSQSNPTITDARLVESADEKSE